MTDLINQLRTTASKGISAWGDLQMEAANQIEALTAERDTWKARCEFSFEQRDKLTAERDELNAQISDALGQISHLDNQITALTAERDFFVMANKDLNSAMGRYEDLHAAAKLASRALNRIDSADIRLDTGERLSITKAIAALRAVL